MLTWRRIREDRIGLVSSSDSGHRFINPAVLADCSPSFERDDKRSSCYPGNEPSLESARFIPKQGESPIGVCRVCTVSASVTQPHSSDFGPKVPMDFSRTTGKIIDDPDEVVAMLKEEQWRAKDQVRLHSPVSRLPYLSSYLVQPWFHGEMSREDAVSMVTADGGEEGTFLIRISRSLPGCFVLSIFHSGGVLHYPIRQVKDQSGERLLSLDSGRTKFMDLLQLVEFYQINAGNCLPTTLGHFVTRTVDAPATPRGSS